jgi:hypothetical protein
MKKLYAFIVILALIFTQESSSQLLFEENFDYPAGDSITQHNWVAHSGSTNMVIVSPGLSYTNYPSSGIGNAVRLDTIGVSGMDVNRNFTEVTSGSVYASYMVKVLYATSTGDYYFHLGNTTLETTFRPKLFIKDDGGNVSFGISKGSNTGTYAAGTYLYNTTYLIVVKYTFMSGASDDEVSMFVFTSPNLPATEPTTPTVGPLTDPGQSDLDNAGTVALRQGVQTNRPVAIMDGIRITESWSGIVEVKNLGQVANTFSLSQNYPNPFNPSTTIKFSIPEASYVTLEVYDILGREVRNLINEDLNSGQYSVNFDASNLSSGTYFYKLIAVANGTNKIINSTRSMILLK